MSDVVMPRLSDTMAEGILGRWLKQEGDAVQKGDVLAEVETDKAAMDLEAFEAGVLERLLVPEGTSVPIGEPVAIIGDGSGVGTAGTSGAGASAETGAAAEPADPAEPEGADAAEPEPATAAEPATTAAAEPRTSGTSEEAGPKLMSPLARRLAREHEIDLTQLTGSGPGGRIVRADIAAAVAAQETAIPSPAPAVGNGDSEEIPLTNMRRVTAKRLTESAAAPHFFLTNVVRVDRLMAFRAEVNERFADEGTKVSVTDLLVRACAVTLRAHPQVNSSWGGDKILRHRRINVGIAVAIDDGLLVPVVHDADTMGLDAIAAATGALAERARAGKLTPDEFSGGTFTISNLGMYGIDNFTAVINPPEAAILAVGATTEEHYSEGGELLSRRIMKITLTVDHRVLDGATAAAFLRDLKLTLEEPLRIVL